MRRISLAVFRDRNEGFPIHSRYICTQFILNMNHRSCSMNHLSNYLPQAQDLSYEICAENSVSMEYVGENWKYLFVRCVVIVDT